MIEDLISTGGSSAKAVQAIRKPRGTVIFVSLFSITGWMKGLKHLML